ncbi:MAG: amidohydrolase family protein [Rubritepida sp.]|nr:amidohydrolase family protein [Rubritepida sp.]
MFTCAPALEVTGTPRQRAPYGACDAHFHIFGPYDRFPLDTARPYTPPPATIPHYLSMAQKLGLTRAVVVQASVYGTDNAVTLDAVAQFGLESARAVVVIDDRVDAQGLQAMHDAGARGVRFNAHTGNGTPLDQLGSLARRIADLGWHIQVYSRGAAMVELAPRLAALPVPVVLDHMAGAAAAEGPDGPVVQAALRLLDTGRAWVKLSGYRSSAPPWADLAPLARRYIAAAPERCLWGTDWPHTQIADPAAMLDDARLLDWLFDWAAEPARILVDNPAALYFA